MKRTLVAAFLLASVCANAEDYTGEIIGGIAGGVIGNQIGGGSGKVVTTAIGAVIGSQVGGRMQQQRQVQQQVQVQQVYPQQIVYVQPQPRVVYVYPVNSPTPLGMRCELQSVYVAGQVIVNNYCY